MIQDSKIEGFKFVRNRKKYKRKNKKLTLKVEQPQNEHRNEVSVVVNQVGMQTDKNNIDDSGESQTKSTPLQSKLDDSSAKQKSKQKESKKRPKRKTDQRCATVPRKKCKVDVCPATSNDKNYEERDDVVSAPFEEDSGIDSNVVKSKRPVVDVPEGVDELNVRMKC